jgi:hypothetical protein
MVKQLIVVAGTPDAEATALAVENGCVGYYQGIPPVWRGIAEEQGWSLPCVVTESEDGSVIAWAPAV